MSVRPLDSLTDSEVVALIKERPSIDGIALIKAMRESLSGQQAIERSVIDAPVYEQSPVQRIFDDLERVTEAAQKALDA